MSKGKQRGKMWPSHLEIDFTMPVPLSCGWASVILSDGMVVAVEWERTKVQLGKAIGKKYPTRCEIAVNLNAPGRILRDYSEGKVLSTRDVSSLPIAWEMIPGFQGRVLRETAGIPYGETVTYGEIAAGVGSPGAARAVGAALARNPWPILVPCHRVLGKGGGLVGFGKGIDAKEALLEFEERNFRRLKVAQ